MKSILTLFACILTISSSNAQENTVYDLEGVDKTTAVHCMEQLIYTMQNPNDLDEITITFDEMLEMLPESVLEEIEKDNMENARNEFNEMVAEMPSFFQEMSSCSKIEVDLFTMMEEFSEEGISGYYVGMDYTCNDEQIEEVGFIMMGHEGKMYLLFVEY